jgi:hypothetical protein
VKSNGVIVGEIDKVKIAHEVVKHPPHLDILDVRQMVVKLASFIREANDFDET